MHGLFEEAAVFRSVWSVTTAAVHHGRFDVDVGLLERIFLYIVALTAERLDWKIEETALAREMRLMTLQAIFSSGLVHPFRIHLLGHFIVACKTQVGAFREEQRIQLRSVRVVTARAVAGDDRLVGAHRRRQLVSDIVVAFRAHRALLTDQDTLE
jgi:hypothetical protein